MSWERQREKHAGRWSRTQNLNSHSPHPSTSPGQSTWGPNKAEIWVQLKRSCLCCVLRVPQIHTGEDGLRCHYHRPSNEETQAVKAEHTKDNNSQHRLVSETKWEHLKNKNSLLGPQKNVWDRRKPLSFYNSTHFPSMSLFCLYSKFMCRWDMFQL